MRQNAREKFGWSFGGVIGAYIGKHIMKNNANYLIIW